MFEKGGRLPYEGVMAERLKISLLNGEREFTVRFVIEKDGKHATCALPTSYDEVDAFLISVRRFLAGAYNDEATILFAGVEVVLIPDNKTVCFRFDNATVKMDGREAGELSLALRSQLERSGVRDESGEEKYRFVGVSPRGNRGCYYWYLDPTFSVCEGDYVWVKMGRHNTEQVVYVDGIRRCGEENVPYPVQRAKHVLRKATEREIETYRNTYLMR